MEKTKLALQIRHDFLKHFFKGQDIAVRRHSTDDKTDNRRDK